MTNVVRRILAPTLVVLACVGVATMLAVPDDSLGQDLSPEEIARLDAFVERFSHGQRLMGSGRDAEAEQVFRDLLGEEPEAAAVHHALGTLLRFRNRPDDATASLLRAAELAPSDAAIQRDAGIDLVQRGHPADAEPYLARARKLWPEEVEVLVLHGTALRAVGRIDEARSAYREAVRVSSNSVDARVGLGALLVETQPAKTIELVEPLPHSFADVCLVHGLALAQLDRIDEARVQLALAVRRSPPGPAGSGIVAQATRALGELVSGDAVVESAAIWCKNSGEPPALEPSVWLASALAANGEPELALAALDEASAKGADVAVLHRAFLVKAGILVRSGRIDDARKALETLAAAEAESPERSVARRALGSIDDEALVAHIGTLKERRNDAVWARALAAHLAGNTADAERLEAEARGLSEPAGEFPGLLLVVEPPSER